MLGGGTASTGNSAAGGSLLDLMADSGPSGTMTQSQPGGASPLDLLDGIGGDIMGGGNTRQITATFCKIPMKPMV